MWTPAGRSQPPNVIGACSRRTTAGTTGRRRSVSLTTASRYSSVAGRAARPAPLEHRGRAREPLERPGERGRGRLVAGDEQRHQLVAQLRVGQRVRRPRRARRAAARRCRRASAPSGSARRAADLLVEQLVGLGARGAIAAPRAARPGAAAGERERQHPASGWRSCRAGAAAARRARSRRRSVLDAEDRAQDHLERDRLHARQHGERRVRRGQPRCGARRPRPSSRRSAHPLAVERRQHQAPLAQVLGRRRAAAPSAGRGSASGRRCPRRRAAGSGRR